jgi:hypothetical protein
MQNGKGVKVNITFLMLYICLTVLSNSLVVIDNNNDSRALKSNVESIFKNSGLK